jgi:hypothetical protein
LDVQERAAFKTFLLRRSAVVEISFHFLPRAVVRLVHTPTRASDHIKPGLSLALVGVWTLVNDSGPRTEVESCLS